MALANRIDRRGVGPVSRKPVPTARARGITPSRGRFRPGAREDCNAASHRPVYQQVTSRPPTSLGLDSIVIKGAREHNLKNVDLTLPRNRLIVITGLSGSGKSSLAFDTIFAEGQRRYVESLSAYARQFLDKMEKPDVDQIDGLSPAISIDQKGTSPNPRSTVGTVTEIYDYMRLMWARIGHPHCPISGHEITRQTTEQIADKVMDMPKGSRVMILAPVVRDRKGEHHDVLSEAKKAGFVRARVAGNLYELTERVSLDKNKKHSVEIVVDRLVIDREGISRLRESVETAAKMAGGLVLVARVDAKGEELLFS